MTTGKEKKKGEIEVDRQQGREGRDGGRRKRGREGKREGGKRIRERY